ncbi:MAG: hypothetical protein EBZ18_04975 [Alphaproteobacteria bacterium]|nr:hypothetical protein [Alphaproteobacteria bacterium]
MKTPILDKVLVPEQLRKLPEKSLKALAQELRYETIDAVSRTGGHLGAGLGVVELTVALHYVFNTPHDKVIWDVGHQAYPHKILTGRRDRIRTLRQHGGLSGFTKRDESEYDPFGAAHSSTSISAGLGMAVARDLKGEDFNVVSVIGDGAMSAGMAYEAMNNAGAMNSKMIVVLNDNDMSIAPAVGALSSYLSQLISSRPFHSIRELAKQVASRFPAEIERTAKRAEEMARGLVGSSTIFSQLGFFYIGPVDGHDLDQLIPILKNLRDGPNRGPVLLHVVTEKGKGHPFGRESGEKYHAVPKFDVITGTQKKPVSNAVSYTAAFAHQFVKWVEQDGDFGKERAIENYRQSIDAALHFVNEGQAHAIGEVGRPHWAVSDEIWDLSNMLLEETFHLAAQHSIPLQLHVEGDSDDTYPELSAMAQRQGMPLKSLIRHYSPPNVSKEYTHGLTPSVLIGKGALDELVETCRESTHGFMLETDYMDDLRRPGAVLGPKTVPKRTKQLIERGLEDEILWRTHHDLPNELYGEEGR